MTEESVGERWSLMRVGPMIPNTVVVWDNTADSPDDVGYLVEKKRGGAWVSYVHKPTSHLLAFLRAHWDVFVDAGWPMDTWFLNGCRKCGASSFEPCRSQAHRSRKPNRTIHQERRSA